MIKNEQSFLDVLEKKSYYRLSGYWYPLLIDKEQHIFKPNADFDTAYKIYLFDKHLRQLVIKELEKMVTNNLTTLVIGASGATGKELVNQLILRGQNVKVIVRPLTKIPDRWETNKSISIIKANVSEIEVNEIAN
ncbi:MAG: Abi family protein [Bacteroidales bacterium]|nr:Abi family protein [Bacteroidales bacterium]